MKLNDKINLIRNKLSEEINPINTKYILNNAHIAPKTVTQKRLKFYSPKFQYFFATLLIIAIIIPIALSQFSLFKKEENAFPDSFSYSIEEVYGFTITSTIALINSANDIFNDTPSQLPNNDLLVYNELPNLNHFLQPIDMLLSYKQNHFKIEESDKNEYSYKIKYNGLNIFDEDLNYNIYYNINNLNEPIETFDFIVFIGDEKYSFNGQKHKNNNQTIFQLTYLLNQDNNKDYLRVTKNLNLSDYSFDYTIVKDDIIVNKSRLTLFLENTPYATLEHIISQEKSTIFKIYTSSEKGFSVKYSISKPPLSNDTNSNEDDIIIEEGQINIDVNNDSSIYHFNSNNLIITIERDK